MKKVDKSRENLSPNLNKLRAWMLVALTLVFTSPQALAQEEYLKRFSIEAKTSKLVGKGLRIANFGEGLIDVCRNKCEMHHLDDGNTLVLGDGKVYFLSFEIIKGKDDSIIRDTLKGVLINLDFQ